MSLCGYMNSELNRLNIGVKLVRKTYAFGGDSSSESPASKLTNWCLPQAFFSFSFWERAEREKLGAKVRGAAWLQVIPDDVSCTVEIFGIDTILCLGQPLMWRSYNEAPPISDVTMVTPWLHQIKSYCFYQSEASTPGSLSFSSLRAVYRILAGALGIELVCWWNTRKDCKSLAYGGSWQNGVFYYRVVYVRVDWQTNWHNKRRAYWEVSCPLHKYNARFVFTKVRLLGADTAIKTLDERNTLVPISRNFAKIIIGSIYTRDG